MRKPAHGHKDNRTEVKRATWDLIRDEVTSHGFEHLKPNCFFRNSEYRIDAIELRMARPGYNSLYSTSPSSFEIESAVFFKFAPHPTCATFAGVDGFPIDNAADGHIRLSSNPKRLLQCGFNSSWWRGDSWKLSKKFILPDVKRNLHNHTLPWFEKFDDLNAVRNHVVAVNSARGKQKIKLDPESWGWVYGYRVLPAFFSLQLKHWEDAQRSLTDLLNNFEKYGLAQSTKPLIQNALQLAESQLLQTA